MRSGLSLKVPQFARSIDLKLGQSVDMVYGTIEKPGARQVTAPEPAGPEGALERLRRMHPEGNGNAPDRR